MPILEARKLTKKYGNTVALDGLDLAVEKGRITGLLGPNGSGKSTLIKLAAGILQPSSGEILIEDGEPSAETKKLVSYLPERLDIPLWMSVRDIFNFFGDFYGDFDTERAENMLAGLQISEKQRVREMSKGTREKVQLITVMSRKAKLYLLDEPIGGVDPATRDYILNTIITAYDPEAAIVISTHLIQDVEPVLDDVIFLRHGSVALMASAESIRAERGMSVDALFREVFRC